MGILIRKGYWVCDRLTGKRIRWVPPQAEEQSKKRVSGIGPGNNHQHFDLVLVNTINLKNR